MIWKACVKCMQGYGSNNRAPHMPDDLARVEKDYRADKALGGL